MLRFKRPTRPPRFAEAVREAAEAVRANIAAGVAPTFDDGIWRPHKAAFIEAQRGKCGYCEQSSLNHPGAVEHYAPKSEVQELIADGVELIPTASIEKRTTPALCDTGYWWLTYAWENWLFVCERCNSWKRCLFPVRERRRTLPPRHGKKETPLLLNPFGKVNPIDHLYFSRVGQIAARDRSERGAATIRTCGLDRESLRRAREGIAADTYRHVERLFVGLKRNDFKRTLDAVVDLLSLGAAARAHAGMARSIVSAELGYRWTDLELLHERLIERARRRR